MDKSEVSIVLFLITIVLSSWWFNQQMQIEERIQKQLVDPHIAAQYSKDMQITTMNTNGQPNRKLIAAKMTHFLDDETTELTKPIYTAYKKDAPPTTVIADKGWISADGNHIYLTKTVNIHRQASASYPELHLKTANLHITGAQNYATTDAEVLAKSQKSWIYAIGMQAWLGEPSRIKLLSKVRGHYETN